MFEVGVDSLEGIKANTPFQINGFIRNKSDYTWKISHGAGMFIYQIYDKEGNLVPPNTGVLFRNDIGFLHELTPGEVYKKNGEEQRSKEYYEFKLIEPGKYKVKTIVHFEVDNGEGKPRTKQEITSDYFSFNVE